MPGDKLSVVLIPSIYGRLVQRRSNAICGYIDYDVSYDGLEDPNCSIVGWMVKFTDTMMPEDATCYLLFDNKWFETKAVACPLTGRCVTFRIPLGAEPVHHEIPTA